jgi:hypothetical protein
MSELLGAIDSATNLCRDSHDVITTNREICYYATCSLCNWVSADFRNSARARIAGMAHTAGHETR